MMERKPEVQFQNLISAQEKKVNDIVQLRKNLSEELNNKKIFKKLFSSHEFMFVAVVSAIAITLLVIPSILSRFKTSVIDFALRFKIKITRGFVDYIGGYIYTSCIIFSCIRIYSIYRDIREKLLKQEHLQQIFRELAKHHNNLIALSEQYKKLSEMHEKQVSETLESAKKIESYQCSEIDMYHQINSLSSTLDEVRQCKKEMESLKQSEDSKMQTEIQQLMATIKEKNEKIKGKDEIIRDMDEVIKDKEDVIRYKDETIKNKDKVIEEKDIIISQKESIECEILEKERNAKISLDAKSHELIMTNQELEELRRNFDEKVIQEEEKYNDLCQKYVDIQVSITDLKQVAEEKTVENSKLRESKVKIEEELEKMNDVIEVNQQKLVSDLQDANSMLDRVLQERNDLQKRLSAAMISGSAGSKNVGGTTPLFEPLSPKNYKKADKLSYALNPDDLHVALLGLKQRKEHQSLTSIPESIEKSTEKAKDDSKKRKRSVSVSHSVNSSKHSDRHRKEHSRSAALLPSYPTFDIDKISKPSGPSRSISFDQNLSQKGKKDISHSSSRRASRTTIC